MTFKKPVLFLRSKSMVTLRILHYTEAEADPELCYYYYITMEELVNLETDKKACTIGLYDSCEIRAWFNRGFSFLYRIAKIRRGKESSRVGPTGLAKMFAGRMFVTSALS